MNEKKVQLAVIGAGPAGLSAAKEAAEQGVEVVVLDMYSQAGGQYFHLPPSEFKIPVPQGDLQQGMTLAQAAQDAGAEIWHNIEVWGVYPQDGFLIGLNGAKEKLLRAGKVIIASGATERTLPFPGWTLPGVMTAGGVLALLKNQRVLAGRSFLFSGTGPLQLAAAAHLTEAGADVKAVLELQLLSTIIRHWRLAGLIPQQWNRVVEGVDYLSVLRRNGTPVRTGWAVIRAEGDEQVERAVIARMDRKGHIIKGSEQRMEVDTICQGYGLMPATRLSQALGCEHTFQTHLRAYTPVRDAWLQTTVTGCFVAGDAAKITGKDAAMIEGRLAAIAAAQQLGLLSTDQAAARVGPLQLKLEQERRFSQALDSVFLPLSGLWDLLEEETIICRCENVTLGQIKQAARDGMDSVAGIKNHTRAGMGWCQGRMCWMNAAQVIAGELGISLEDASRHTVRPPVFPVTLGDLLDEQDE
jgi:D-hydroxyproline dehydrogenase subunit alpha